MAMEMSTKSLESDGHLQLIEAKSLVQDADISLLQKANHAVDALPKVRRSGKHSSVAGTLITSTATKLDISAPVMPVATGATLQRGNACLVKGKDIVFAGNIHCLNGGLAYDLFS